MFWVESRTITNSVNQEYLLIFKMLSHSSEQWHTLLRLRLFDSTHTKRLYFSIHSFTMLQDDKNLFRSTLLKHSDQTLNWNQKYWTALDRTPVDEEELEVVNNIKYLEVMIDYELDFKQNEDYIYVKKWRKKSESCQDWPAI